jgi:peptide/nickel transport system substrate-binding protein
MLRLAGRTLLQLPIFRLSSGSPSRRRVIPKALAVALCIASLATVPAFASSRVGESAAARSLTVEDIGLSWSSLDPVQPGLGTLLSPVFSPAYDYLIEYGPTGALVPGLATSWSWNKARNVFTLNLRKGVHFQDGTVFNATAAVFNLQRMASAALSSECEPYFTQVTSIVASGPYQVKMTFTTPYAAITAVLSGLPCSVMASPQAVAAGGGQNSNTALSTTMDGTGPYKFSGETLNSSITFTYWPGAWDASKVHYSTITINASADDQSALDTLETGGAQVVIGGDVQDAAIVKSDKSLRSVFDAAQGYVNIRLEVSHSSSPFNNVIARQVLALGINTTAITKGLYQNKAIPTETYETPNCFCFKGYKVDGYPQYNPTRAAQLVQQLPGGKLSFTMNEEDIPNYTSLGDVIQAQLQEIPGVTVTLNPLSETALLAAFHSKSYVAGLTSSPTIPDPDLNYYKNFYSASNNNQTGIDDPALDNLLIEARETVSDAQRAVLYLQAQKLLAKDLPQIPLFAQPVVVISTKQLKNFSVQLSSGYTFVGSSL